MADYTSVDIYEEYKEKVEDPLPKNLWQELCVEFNTKVMKEIIYNGREFNMGERLSTLQVVRVPRNFDSPTPNWKKSNELKQKIIDEGGTPKSEENPDGENWLVYYTDDWYCRFYWRKVHCVVQNKTAYRFTPTRGNVGNKRMLKDHLRDDEMAYTKYRLLD